MAPAPGASLGDGSVVVDAGEADVRPLDPSRDAEAAALLAACTPHGTVEAGRELLAAARAETDTSLYGLFAGDDLAAVYALRKTGLSLELSLLVVAEPLRRRGHGRACLADALRRAGKRPLVVETDEATLGFYRAAGFKLVGKRRDPSGSVRYRFGWHAPTPARPLVHGQNRRSTLPCSTDPSLLEPGIEDRGGRR